MYRQKDLFILKALRLLSLSTWFIFTLCVFPNHTQISSSSLVTSEAFSVPFSDFSPAYAAFEDEFMFEDDFVVATALPAGESVSIEKIEKILGPKAKKSLAKKALSLASWVSSEPDSTLHSDSTKRSNALKKVNGEFSKDSQTELSLSTMKLSFGPMIAVNDTRTSIQASTSQTMEKPSPAPEKSEELKTKSLENSFWVKGAIELKDGLAFLGAMEVSWVVNDEEIRRGYINMVDGTYEINIPEIIGQIYISLYSENDELVGEGVVDLEEISSIKELSSADIDVRPIDWNKAGQVYDAHYIGPGVKARPVQETRVDLYAFNASTETNAKGEIRFPDWKKSNSRTLALASKKGYRDSIFLIDSKKMAKTLLFPNSYIDSFFTWLEDQLGIFNVKDQGTIYGAIVSNGEPQSGFQVHLEGKSPLYFMDGAPIALKDKKVTSTNGLFAFVGLDDGEYLVLIEKDGVVIDRQLVVVEQAKISPLWVDVVGKKKKLQFFDPMDGERKPKAIVASFFDGEQALTSNNNGEIVGKTASSASPNLVDYQEVDGLASTTFISRERKVEWIPVVDKHLINKVLGVDTRTNHGVALAFLQSPIKYKVRFEEMDPEKITYFNLSGQVIDPNIEVAYGFAISGFPPGLYTLVVESVEDPTILMTDLVFNDHQSISIINNRLTL